MPRANTDNSPLTRPGEPKVANYATTSEQGIAPCVEARMIGYNIHSHVSESLIPPKRISRNKLGQTVGHCAGSSPSKRIKAGELNMADPEPAVIQLYALVLYPHFAHIAYGERISKECASQLIHKGVDMFLAYYTKGMTGQPL